METTKKSVKKQIITLDKVNVRNLPELQGWKEKQNQVVKNHPFVAIQDNQTYEQAKKHRTALVSARTDIQKQDKLIASKLKELRSESKKVAEELIQITQPHEDKQQDEVKRYEDKKEIERKERERIERERKEAIQYGINTFYRDWKNKISQTVFTQLEDIEKGLEIAIQEQSKKEMEEFEMDFSEKVNLLNAQIKERTKYLTEQEEARKERERLEAERKAFEEEKRKEEEARKAREEEEIKKREAQEAERKAKEEKERKAREAEESKIRAEREAEAEKFRKEREDFEAEKNRLAEEKRKIQEAIEAEQKAKREAEEKAKKEAEAKRQKELQPDKTKAETFINSLKITEAKPNFNSKEVQEFTEQFELEIEKIKASYIDALKSIK